MMTKGQDNCKSRGRISRNNSPVTQVNDCQTDTSITVALKVSGRRINCLASGTVEILDSTNKHLQ